MPKYIEFALTIVMYFTYMTVSNFLYVSAVLKTSPDKYKNTQSEMKNNINK